MIGKGVWRVDWGGLLTSTFRDIRNGRCSS